MIFKFKEFDILQEKNSQKVGTDSMILGALVSQFNIEPKSILDIGTGTGVLALMVAQAFNPNLVIGVDIQKSNCVEAQTNFDNSSFVSEFKTVHADISKIDFKIKFDLIISNPPYFQNSLLSEVNEKNIARHQDTLSIKSLACSVNDNLLENGVFACVYPYGLQEDVLSEFSNCGLFPIRIVQTVNNQDFVRSFVFFVKDKVNMSKVKIEELIVRDSEGDYTDEYIGLTKAFHWKDLSKKKGR